MTPTSPTGKGHRVPSAVLKPQLEPTVVHRTQFTNRPSLVSIDRGVISITPETSPSVSNESSSNSGKSSVPRTADSTGKTSVNSIFSTKSKAQSQYSSENKYLVKHTAAEPNSNDNPLSPIVEGHSLELQAPEPVPTFITVEKAASAKVFFECHYNDLTSRQLAPRSLRRRELEGLLYQSQHMSATEMDEIRQSWAADESDHLRHTRIMKARAGNVMNGQTMAASRYEIVKVLGKGSFGVVRLVREKVEEPQNRQEGHLHAERDFLVAAEGSRWVVPLLASFQDLSNLYLVMEYMPGGDFLGLLIRENVLSEPVTKWYISEMILCIEEAHTLNWIHRDIKPDNFLISASGHLKISDFGLAFDGHWSHDQSYFNNHRYSLLTKLGINVDGDSIDKKEGKTVAAAMKMAHVMMGGKERHEIDLSSTKDGGGILNWRNKHSNRSFARSVVGTSQYMAPEVVRGELYDARCDWWSVAIILYECLYGHTPFLAEEGGRQQTKLNIISHKNTFSFPHKPVVSRRCQDLIRSIIQEKEHRLCSKRYHMKDPTSTSPGNQDYAGRCVYAQDAEDIKSHKWFRDIPWDRLHLTLPPIVPEIQSMEDTHYFDEEEPISDFSESISAVPHTAEEFSHALRPFNREIQILTKCFIEQPHDSARLRRIEKEIDQFVMCDEQKQYLKTLVRIYGQKEKKRPRDRLLRDKVIGPQVLELRKKGAFLGYTYRRFRCGTKCERGSIRQLHYGTGSIRKPAIWHRARISIH